MLQNCLDSFCLFQFVLYSRSDEICSSENHQYTGKSQCTKAVKLPGEAHFLLMFAESALLLLTLMILALLKKMAVLQFVPHRDLDLVLFCTWLCE